jgi:hypothetical protein
MATVTRDLPKNVKRTVKGGGAADAAQLSITVENIDRATAEDYLEKNDSNRTVRPRRVQEFKRDMLAGEWRDVGDPIRFDTNGRLVDGQHRLHGVMAATEADGNPDLSITFVVVRGVEPEDRHVIDTGTRRTAGDQLKMAGYRNAALLAAATKWCLLVDRGLNADALVRSVTHAEIMDFVHRNPTLVEITEHVAYRMRASVDMPAGYIAAGYFLCQRIDERAAEEFFERLTDGAMLEAGDPILALRSRLRDLARNRANLSGDMWLSLLFRTWNARREGRQLRVLPVDRGGKPIPAPALV